MKERKDYRYIAALILGILVGVVLWVILICLKAAGVATMNWALVLSAFVWLTWIVYAFMFLVVTIVWIAFFIKRWYRRRKADARIIRQAKAAGVWDKQPIVLGGRALELKAWEDFKIKREPGEPDAHLRRRCIAAADNELANSPSSNEERIEKPTKKVKAVYMGRDGKAIKIWPPEKEGEGTEKRHDEIEKDTPREGESANE